MSKRLRWKKDKEETGLAAVGAGPRGYIYHDGETEYASVSALGGGWRGPVKGWYFVAGCVAGIPHKNTLASPCATPEEAKKQATAYVKEHLATKEAL